MILRQSILDNATAISTSVTPEDVTFWQTKERSVSVKNTKSNMADVFAYFLEQQIQLPIDHCISEHVVNKLSLKFSFLNVASTSACRSLHNEHVHNLFNA
jgi:hypothetical protein